MSIYGSSQSWLSFSSACPITSEHTIPRELWTEGYLKAEYIVMTQCISKFSKSVWVLVCLLEERFHLTALIVSLFCLWGDNFSVLTSAWLHIFATHGRCLAFILWIYIFFKTKDPLSSFCRREHNICSCSGLIHSHYPVSRRTDICLPGLCHLCLCI